MRNKYYTNKFYYFKKTYPTAVNLLQKNLRKSMNKNKEHFLFQKNCERN